MYDEYKKYFKEKQKTISGIIRITGAVHLGFLATIFYCGYILNNSYIDNNFLLDIDDFFGILFSIILFVILVAINKNYYKDYDKDLEIIIGKYKKERKNL